jgi:hypothetical protein
MVPIVKNLRDMASHTNGQDKESTNLDKAASQISPRSVPVSIKHFAEKVRGGQGPSDEKVYSIGRGASGLLGFIRIKSYPHETVPDRICSQRAT